MSEKRMRLSASRYFSGTKHTLNYLANEHLQEPERKEKVREALTIVEAAEENIFEVEYCPVCDKMLKAIDGENIDEKVAKHKAAIHKQ